jgi:hypothetical protein
MVSADGGENQAVFGYSATRRSWQFRGSWFGSVLAVAMAFDLQNFILPAVVGALFCLVVSRMREPNRRGFMVVMIAGAGAASFNGGFGPWELVFTALVTFCAYQGLQDYRVIGAGWLLHTAWDVLHHLYGNPIIPFVSASSRGCAVCDAVIALWCFADAPSFGEWRAVTVAKPALFDTPRGERP